MSLCLFSCSTDALQDGDTLEVQKKSVSVQQRSTWEEQVEYALKKSETRAGSSDIRLVKYTYKGKVKNEAEALELLEQMFDENVNVVRYLDSVNYEIIPLKEYRQKVGDSKEWLKAQLDTVITEGIDVIDFEWNYKGRTITSTAIASNKLGGVLYDHIGCMIVDAREKPQPKVTNISRSHMYMKTRSESGQMREMFFHLQGSSPEDRMGRPVWEYEILCTSYFDANGILRNRSTVATYYSAYGWHCEAQARTVSGKIDVSKHHTFAWAHAYRHGGNVAIGWDGFSYSISYGSIGAVGSATHRISY